MKKIQSIVAVLAVMLIMAFVMTGCSEADRVSKNVSKEADNFNVTRRLEVINSRTDKPMFELIGNFSIQNSSHGELEIIVEVENGKYKKHFVYLNDWTTYVVEDVSGAYVDKYHYEINYLPQMIKPVTFTNKD